MKLIDFVKEKNWPSPLGYALFVGMMATGYYYNITFVQLGLTDLGARLIGMTGRQVSSYMAVFALITCLVAISFGSSASSHWCT